MRKLQRLIGVVVVLIMLLGSIGSVATAEQGTQTGTDTQTGGGKTGPNRPEPTPPPATDPAPEPPQTPQQPPSNNNGGGGGTTTTPRNSSGVSAQTGSQGPNRPAPQPVDPPSGGGGTGEFWILVDKSDHMTYAFRGDTQVFSAINNVGAPGWETPSGTFRINTKLRYDDMTLYSNLPAVPSVMYFTDRGHAIHGTYWTAVDGRNVSHGCVNLSERNAQILFDMTPLYTRVVIRA